MDILLRVDNHVTYIDGHLDSEMYKQLKRKLGYLPDDAIWMVRKQQTDIKKMEAEGKKVPDWKKEWDGYISTICYNQRTCKCNIKKSGTHFPTGLVSRVVDFLKTNNISFAIKDIRQKYNSTINWQMSDNFELRDYQQEVIKNACNVDRGIIKLSTGGGKCISKDSLCLTEGGLLTFEEMIGSDIKLGEYVPFTTQVYTPLANRGYDQTSHIYYDGERKNSIKITSSYGFNIKGTSNHLVKIISKNGLEWKKLKDIKEGDYVAISRNTKVFGTNETLTEEDAYWLGLLFGDGCITSKNVIKLTTADNHIEEFARKYATSMGLKINRYDDKRTNSTRSLDICSVEYRKFLYNLGINYSHSYEKEIPLIIRTSKEKQVAAFIRGLYETDGFVTTEKSKPTINIAFSSEKMIRQLHLLLLNFGIISSFRRKKTKRRDSFVLTIYRNSILLFGKCIGFDTMGYKIKQFDKSIDIIKKTNSNTNLDIFPNYSLKFKKIKRILQKMYGYHNISKIIESSGIKKRTFDSWIRKDYYRNPSMKHINLLSDWILSINDDLKKKEVEDLHNIAKDLKFLSINFFFDKIIKKEIIYSDNYDFVIPETHSFVAQGFVNHNTSIASSIIANRGNTPTIFYVPSIDLLTQAKQEIEKFIRLNDLPITVGELSGGKKNIQDITVMTIQTAVRSLGGVWVKYDEEDVSKEKEDINNIKKDVQNLIHNAKLIICDEVQHWAAETCQIISDNSYSARYRYGMSATPKRDKGDDILIDSCFGKTIADINASLLIKKGYLVKPMIRFYPMSNKRGILKSNYNNIYKEAIVENAERNRVISSSAQAFEKEGRRILILCKQIAHGKLLEKLIPGSIFLHGEHSGKKRQKHLEEIRNGEKRITIASVIFDEGIDCRPLDTLILAGSGKSPTRALQRVGRVLRPYVYPDGRVKDKAIVLDFMDRCKYMESHSKKRLKMYKSEPEFDVEVY